MKNSKYWRVFWAVVFMVSQTTVTVWGSGQADARQYYENLGKEKTSGPIENRPATGSRMDLGRAGKGLKFITPAETVRNYPCEFKIVFDELPLTSIKPAGWIKTYLEDQAGGLTGNIKVTGYPFDTKMWACPAIKLDTAHIGDWAQYEQTAFYLDGLLRVGLLLGDNNLINRVIEQIEYVMSNPDTDGLLGPRHVKSRWPRANFFRMMRAYYNATGDERVVRALASHFRQDTNNADTEEFGRSSVTIETLAWLYQLTGDKEFVRIALASKKYFDDTNPGHACSTNTLLSENMPSVHGAMFAEMVHLPAMLYMCTGQENWLAASVKGYDKVFKYNGLPDGIFSSEEGTNGQGVRKAHETCAIVDYSYNTGYMLMATGQGKWADGIERAVLNAGTSIVTNRFRAYQYFSAPNQPRSDHWSSHIDAPHEKDPNLTHFSRDRMCYRPGSSVPCCSGSVHRIMPAYVSRMYLTDNKGGLVVALYGPSSITAKVGQTSQQITMTQKTEYPFSNADVDLKISTQKPVRFKLYLRVPGWCEDTLEPVINGKTVHVEKCGGFVIIDREFKNGDVVRMPFEENQKIKVVDYPTGGQFVERGPLVYTLKIKEKRIAHPYIPWDASQHCPDSRFTEFDIYPASPWNYALAADAEHIEKEANVIKHRPGSRPFESGNSPLEIKLPVKRVPGWDYIGLPKNKVLQWPHEKEQQPDVYLFTPDLPKDFDCASEVEYVRFVPYGSTCIRMTILPRCGKE